MAVITTTDNYSATIIPEDIAITASLNERGPRGLQGKRGLPAFIQFHINDGYLVVEQMSDDYTFQIVDGELIVEWDTSEA